jgi:hypothetical protein
MAGSSSHKRIPLARLGRRIPLKTFYRGPVPHKMGIRYSIDNLELELEFDALFDTKSDHAHLKPALIGKIRDHFPAVTDIPPGYPPVYHVPLTIHLGRLDSHSHNHNQNRPSGVPTNLSCTEVTCVWGIRRVI